MYIQFQICETIIVTNSAVYSTDINVKSTTKLNTHKRLPAAKTNHKRKSCAWKEDVTSSGFVSVVLQCLPKFSDATDTEHPLKSLC